MSKLGGSDGIRMSESEYYNQNWNQFWIRIIVSMGMTYWTHPYRVGFPARMDCSGGGQALKIELQPPVRPHSDGPQKRDEPDLSAGSRRTPEEGMNWSCQQAPDEPLKRDDRTCQQAPDKPQKREELVLSAGSRWSREEGWTDPVSGLQMIHRRGMNWSRQQAPDEPQKRDELVPTAGFR